MSGASTVNIKPITQKHAQKLWRCGIPLLWKDSCFLNAEWREVDYGLGSPRTQAEYRWYMKFGVAVE